MVKTFRVYLLIIICSFICALTARAQTNKYECSLVEDKTGAYYLFANDRNSFTIKVEAKKIKPTKYSGTVMADNRFLQITSVPNLNYQDTSEAAVKKLLTEYMDSELDYIKKEFKIDVQGSDSEFIKLNGRYFLFWQHPMPGDNKSIAAQQYVITPCFDQIIIFNSQVQNVKNDDEAVKKFLIATAQTIKTYDKPIDSQEFYDQLHKKK